MVSSSNELNRQRQLWRRQPSSQLWAICLHAVFFPSLTIAMFHITSSQLHWGKKVIILSTPDKARYKDRSSEFQLYHQPKRNTQMSKHTHNFCFVITANNQQTTRTRAQKKKLQQIHTQEKKYTYPLGCTILSFQSCWDCLFTLILAFDRALRHRASCSHGHSQH